MRDYIDVADTAKIVRKELKRHFPGTKFSVRSSRYAGGASIDISYTDGPRQRDVDALLAGFSGKRFDGMIDLAYSADSYYCDEHGAGVYRTYGHSYDNDKDVNAPCCLAARVVHYGADYVHSSREVSDELIASLEHHVVENGGRVSNGGREQCAGCGSFFYGREICDVVHVNDRYDSTDYSRTEFVCSKRCGARVIAISGLFKETEAA